MSLKHTLKYNQIHIRVKWKISYQARGPFQIVKILGNNSYEVKRYNKTDSAVQKYKGSKLYLLPPAILPHDPLGTTDQWYLNHDHAPIVSPLKKPMNIELYNDNNFSEKGQHAFTSNPYDKYSASVDTNTSKPHMIIPTITPAVELFQESDNLIPTIESIEATTLRPHSSHTINFNNTLHNKLFFIQYNPDGIMQCRWYPIQIDIPSTK